MRTLLLAFCALVFVGPAMAQTGAASPPAGANTAPKSPVSPPAVSPDQAAKSGSPAVANSGPGSVATTPTEATGAGSVSNNPAKAGNSSTPSRAAPNGG